MTYKKLFPIDYNNKKFMLFLDENNHKTFLEIDSTGEYVYPLVEDYIALYKIFNIKEPFICYSVPRYRFQEKVRRVKGTVASLLTVITLLNSLPKAQAGEITLEVKENDTNIELVENVKTNTEAKWYVDITDLAYLDRYLGELDVTQEMVIEAINSNDNLNQKYKTIALNLLEAITSKYPNYNLRIFYENIKTMKIVEYTIEEFREAFPDAIGAGAQYNYALNEIITIDEVEWEVLYHEMFHATNTFYHEQGNLIIRKTEDNVSLNEAMTDLGASLVLPNKNSYVFDRKILEYLLSNVDYTLEDYNNKGIDYLLEKLSNKYPNIDFNYINETLNAINTRLIYLGKQTRIDACPDLINELFALCLENVSLENGYEPFNHFAKIFYNAENPELVFTYYEEYNNKLKEIGYQNIISKEEVMSKFNVYREATGIAYEEDIFPVMATNAFIERIKPNGERTTLNQVNYTNAFDFISLISSTMFENYNTFGTPEYWQHLAYDNGLLNPKDFQEIQIYLNGKLLTTMKASNLMISVGLTKNNEIGFILTTAEGEVIYANDTELKNLSNSISFSAYISKYSRYIDQIELNNVLTEDYLSLISRTTSYFKNIEVVDKKVIIEPMYKLKIIRENLVTTVSVNDCTISKIEGIISIKGTDISFPSTYDLEESLNLKDVLEHLNVLNPEIETYTFSEDELISMIENYLQELNNVEKVIR